MIISGSLLLPLLRIAVDISIKIRYNVLNIFKGR